MKTLNPANTEIVGVKIEFGQFSDVDYFVAWKYLGENYEINLVFLLLIWHDDRNADLAWSYFVMIDY